VARNAGGGFSLDLEPCTLYLAFCPLRRGWREAPGVDFPLNLGPFSMIYKLLRLITNINLKLLGGICLTILVIILIAGFWPFNFFPKNKVAWLKDKNGVYFSGQGMILSPDPLNDPQQSLLNKKSITIEILIHTTEEPQNGISRILSIYEGEYSEITFLGQWKKHLIIQSRIKKHVGNILHSEIGVDDALGKDQNYFLSITSGTEGTTIYINGQPARTYQHHRLLDSITSKKIGFILGNSPVGKTSWKGRIMKLAIYNRAFTAKQVFKHYQLYLENNFTTRPEKEGCIGLYLFNEKQGAAIRDYSNLNNHLTIPALFRPVKKIILESPWQDFRWNKSFVQDTIVNLFGFVPLGFFFTAFLLKASNWKKKIIYICIVATGFAISLAIELSQIYLPSRYSQLDDVICNSVGTALGIVILHLIIQRKKVHP
jgi:glycopeptide antibiotics resistance protein